MGIYGQDWASYQPAEPDTSGLGFAIIKVTEGLGYTNPKWQSQRDTARAAGLVVGYYHYPHMANSDRAEADRFLSIADPQPGELVVLDWEGYDAANTHVSAADQLAYKEDFLQYVKSRLPHNPVGMYCNTDYWNRVDTTGHVGDFLWIATAGRAAGDPGIRADWLIHQYGGSGDTDLDYCHLDSTDELRAWALAFATPEEDIVTPQDIQAALQAAGPALAQAVWDHQVPVPRLLDDGTVNYAAQQAAVWPQIWGNVWTARILKAIAAQQAALTALITQLSAAHPGVDTATVVAAVEQAIANAVINVDVHVQTPSPTNP